MPGPVAPRPLSGTCVIELGENIGPAFCGRILADLGAEVIKVERPRQGDPSRWLGPFLPRLPYGDSSALFIYNNLGKLSITLDVRRPTGRELLRRLLASADVFICGLTPEEQDALALSPAELKAINRRLVTANVTPFGLDGPYRTWSVNPLVAFHAGGEGITVASAEQDESWPPLKAYGHVPEYDIGYCAVVAVLAALVAREDDGEGDHVETSYLDVAMALGRIDIPRYLNEGWVQTRENQPLRHNLLRCADGYVDVTAPDDAGWQGLKELLGWPEWMDSPRFATRHLREANRPEWNPHLEAWTSVSPRQTVREELQRAGVATDLVNTLEDVLASPQYAHRELWTTLEAEGPQASLPALPFLADGVRWRARALAPRLGEHNEEVFLKRLRLSFRELEVLRAAGIV